MFVSESDEDFVSAGVMTITIDEADSNGVPSSLRLETSDGLRATTVLTALFASVGMVVENIIQGAMSAKFNDLENDPVMDVADLIATPLIRYVADNLSGVRNAVEAVLQNINASSFEDMKDLAEHLAMVESLEEQGDLVVDEVVNGPAKS